MLIYLKLSTLLEGELSDRYILCIISLQHVILWVRFQVCRHFHYRLVRIGLTNGTRFTNGKRDPVKCGFAEERKQLHVHAHCNLGVQVICTSSLNISLGCGAAFQVPTLGPWSSMWFNMFQDVPWFIRIHPWSHAAMNNHQKGRKARQYLQITLKLWLNLVKMFIHCFWQRQLHNPTRLVIQVQAFRLLAATCVRHQHVARWFTELPKFQKCGRERYYSSLWSGWVVHMGYAWLL